MAKIESSPHSPVNPMTLSGMGYQMALQTASVMPGKHAPLPQSRGSIGEGHSLLLRRVFRLAVANR